MPSVNAKFIIKFGTVLYKYFEKKDGMDKLHIKNRLDLYTPHIMRIIK
jgi:hypothetical protein